jgi:hypothetical protein
MFPGYVIQYILRVHFSSNILIRFSVYFRDPC